MAPENLLLGVIAAGSLLWGPALGLLFYRFKARRLG